MDENGGESDDYAALIDGLSNMAKTTSERTVVLDRSGGTPLGIKYSVKAGEPGVKISEIMPGSIAESNGNIKPGDYILSVNDKPMRNVTSEAVRQAMTSNEIVKLVLSDKLPEIVAAPEYESARDIVASAGSYPDDVAPQPMATASTSETEAYVAGNSSIALLVSVRLHMLLKIIIHMQIGIRRARTA